MTDKLITIAIHTLRHAVALKSLLEREGVKVTFQNVNLENPCCSAGVRVRIHESDLPVALRIIENPEIFPPVLQTAVSEQRIILVPFDFSPHSVKAAKIASVFASTHQASVKLLYSFLDPVYSKRSQLNDSLDFDNDEAHDTASNLEKAQAEKKFDEFENELVGLIKNGQIPPANFSHFIAEGVPEEAISNYARDNHPILIVMGTRDAHAKARELVGSVTAEVLDTCRYPIMTVPSSIDITGRTDVSNIMFFSNFDQQDILAIDTLLRLLPKKFYNFCLVKLPSKKFSGDVTTPLNRLREYCEKHYAGHSFTVDTMQLDTAEDDFQRIMQYHGIELIAVPNKKKNMVARFFNPGVAHRLLFQTDIPMMVIPI